MKDTKANKDVLPTLDVGPKARGLSCRRVVLWIVALAVVWYITCAGLDLPYRRPCMGSNHAEMCPQTDSLRPITQSALYDQLGALLETNTYETRAVTWLGGAVRIPTESFDKMGPVGQDPRWEAFKPFHAYLRTAYPQVHKSLRLTKVNTYGLVYHWQGSDDSLKPLLLAAHQDVVPVDPNTVDEWAHPPYSGYYDGTFLWGRGAADDKSGLISTMSAIEILLERGFNPQRSVVLAFGFDEEASGVHGAQAISKYLLEVYGKDAFALLVDEGGGWTEQYGQIVAAPAIAEKGYLDVRIDVSSPGGHSSVPPSHTSIGILAALLVEIESHPRTSHFVRTNPAYQGLQCLAAHAPSIPKALRKTIKRSAKSKRALRKLEEEAFADPRVKAMAGTTQAIDLISGGVKTNALPEQASAVVNHRIATDSSVKEVQKYITDLLSPVASRFNLSVSAFGETLSSHSEAYYGSMNLSDAWGTALEPAPVTPTGLDAEAYKLLSGTIQASLLDSELLKGKNRSVIVAPGISTGNTDTRYYWSLTPNIFRYNHRGTTDTYGGVHTTNEAIKISGILREIKFFTTLILNADESRAI